MTTFQIIASLLTLAALGGYVNHRYMKLPATIGHMAFALILSLVAVVLVAPELKTSFLLAGA
jgi:CPA1 family monovalent cation:H+ antiporter